jgi:predicted lactoylglutathione lyase
MIGYITLGTNDMVRAAAFYDALLAELGAKRAMQAESFIAWGTNPLAPMISIIKPFNKQPATVGNGVMISIAATNPAQVDKVYRKAIALGAKDEGPAGPRGPTFYAGYFRDLDGNKLNVFCMTKPAESAANPEAKKAEAAVKQSKPAAKSAKAAASKAPVTKNPSPGKKTKTAAVKNKASTAKKKKNK